MVNILHINENHYVTKSNVLIEANYKLSTREQKIILCLASHIEPEDEDFKTYTLSIKEFNETLGLKGSAKYTELRQITFGLMKKGFEVHIENKVIQVSWLSYVAYNTNQGTVDLRFDAFLKPYFLQIAEQFTSYRLENILKLQSSYSIRIYELLKQYETIGYRTFDVEELKQKLQVQKTYDKYANFKQRVLHKAQEELQDKTDISFQIEEIKNGRKVQSVKLHILKNKKHITEKPVLSNKEDVWKKNLKQCGVKWTKEIQTSVNNAEENVLQKACSVLTSKEDITNKTSYFLGIVNGTSKDAHADVVQELIYSYKKSRELIPDWLVKINFDAICENRIEEDEREELWNKHKDSIMKQIETQIKTSMKRKK